MLRTVLAAAIGFGTATSAGAFSLTLPDTADFRFTRDLRPGQSLAISNIDGSVTITRASGRTAEVVVTRNVRRGNGELVKAILVETSNGIKVCTVYLRTVGENRTDCRGGNGNNHRSLEVEMVYEVRLPAGVTLEAGTVDGDLSVDGIDTPARISTVDGNVRLRGMMPERVSSVDGNVELDVTGRFTHDSHIHTVDGTVDITLPANAALEVSATAVDARMSSDFPLTIGGRWSTSSMKGTINGGGPSLRISSVDGRVSIHRR